MGSEVVAIDLALPGAFNRANGALALLAARAWGVDAATASERMRTVASVEGRFEVRTWAGRQWRLMLAKNPAGFAALLPEVAVGRDDLVVAINAAVADGHDPAWLYDAPFELLHERRVWCDGARALDLATRLDYGGVSVVAINDLFAMARDIRATDPIDVVANYTAFAQWRERTSPC